MSRPPTSDNRMTHSDIPNARPRPSPLLPVIGVFKLAKAAILFAAAYAFRFLRHSPIEQTLIAWADAIHVDPEGRRMRLLIDKFVGASPIHLHLVGIGLFVYGCLFTTEGVGLLLRKRWGEYVTVAITSLLLPLEVYELLRPEHRAVKVLVLVANLAILAYLIWNLYRTRPGPAGHPSNATAVAVTS